MNNKCKNVLLSKYFSIIIMSTIIQELEISKLIISENNVRKDLKQINEEDSTIDDLANDIEQNGLINPIPLEIQNLNEIIAQY